MLNGWGFSSALHIEVEVSGVVYTATPQFYELNAHKNTWVGEK